MNKKDDSFWTIIFIIFIIAFLVPASILPTTKESSGYFWKVLGILVIVAGILTMFAIRWVVHSIKE